MPPRTCAEAEQRWKGPRGAGAEPAAPPGAHAEPLADWLSVAAGTTVVYSGVACDGTGRGLPRPPPARAGSASLCSDERGTLRRTRLGVGPGSAGEPPGGRHAYQ